MNLHEERIKIFEKHIFPMKMVNRSHYISTDVPDDMLTNAIRKYAPDVDKKTVIGIYDLSLFCNGKAGFLFTDEKLYCSQVMDKPERIYYTDIVGISDDKEPYKIILNGGKEVPIFNTVVKEHLKYLNEFIQEIRKFNKLHDDESSDSENFTDPDNQNMNNYRARRQNRDMIKIIETYFPQIEKKSQIYCSYYSGKNIPKKMLDKVASKIDRSIDIDTVIGIIDTTPLDSGKTGYVFTNDKLYSRGTLEKTKITRYRDIKEISILNDGKDDLHKSLCIKFITGGDLKIFDSGIAKTPFKACLDELVRVSKNL